MFLEGEALGEKLSAEWPLEGSSGPHHGVVSRGPIRGGQGSLGERGALRGRGGRKTSRMLICLLPSLHSPIYPLPGRSVAFE